MISPPFRRFDSLVFFPCSVSALSLSLLPPPFSLINVCGLDSRLSLACFLYSVCRPSYQGRCQSQKILIFEFLVLAFLSFTRSFVHPPKVFLAYFLFVIYFFISVPKIVSNNTTHTQVLVPVAFFNVTDI